MNDNINISLRVNTQNQSVTALRGISQGLLDVADAATRATDAINSTAGVNQVFRAAPVAIAQSSKAVTVYDELIQGLFQTIKETKDKGIVPILGALTGGLNRNRKTTAGFAGEVAALTASMASGFIGVAGTIGLLDRAISKTGTSLSGNVTTSFFKAVNQEVNNAVSGTAKLSSIMKSIGSVAEPFTEGFLGVGDRQPVLDSLSDKMKRVSQKTSRILSQKIPLLDINNIVSEYLQQAVPEGISGAKMSKERADRRLSPLQKAGNAFKEQAAGIIQNSDLAQLAPRQQTAFFKKVIRQENELLTAGLQFAFTQGVSSLDRVSGQVMRLVGRIATTPLTEELRSGAKEFDRLVDGSVQKFKDDKLPKFATAVRNKASLESAVPLIMEGLGDVIPGSFAAGAIGSILQGLTNIPGTKDLFQASGDDFASKVLKNPSAPIVKALTQRVGYGNNAGGVEGGVGGLIASLFTTEFKNIPLLNQASLGGLSAKYSNFSLGKGIGATIDMLTPFKPIVENLVLGLTEDVTTGITGALYNTVKTELSVITPNFVKAGYSNIKKIFPNLDKIVFDKFGDTAKTLFKPFLRSDFQKEYGSLNKEIDSLTRKLLRTEPAGLDERANQLAKEAKQLEVQRRAKRIQQIKKQKVEAERNTALNSTIAGLLDPNGALGLPGLQRRPTGQGRDRDDSVDGDATTDYRNSIIAGLTGQSGRPSRSNNARNQLLGEQNSRQVIQEHLGQLPDNLRAIVDRIAGNIYRDPTRSIGEDLMKQITSEGINSITSMLPSETAAGISNVMLQNLVRGVADVVAAAPEQAQKETFKKEQELKEQAKELRDQADLIRRGKRQAPPTREAVWAVRDQLKMSLKEDRQNQDTLPESGRSEQTEALIAEFRQLLEARSVSRKLQAQENQRIADRQKLVDLKAQRRGMNAERDAAYQKAGYLTEFRANIEGSRIFPGNAERTQQVYSKQQEIKRINDAIPAGGEIAPKAKVKRNRLQEELDQLMIPDAKKETRLYQIDQEIEKILAPYETVPERVARKMRNFWPAIREVLKDPRGIEQLRQVDDFLEGALSQAAEQVMRTSTREAAKGVGQQLITNMMPAIDAIDGAVLGTVDRVRAIPQRFSAPTAAASNFFLGLASATEPLSALSSIVTKVGQVGTSIFMATQQVALFTSGFQGIAQIVQASPLGAIVRQADALDKQIISIQASVVATNRVVKGGLVTDKNESAYAGSSLEGIKLSRKQVEAGVDRIREGSLEIANVTSSQLIDPFLNIASLSGVTRMNLNQSAELTLKFAAAMSTMNIPAGQNRQEIQSILQGTIDQNSVLAKTLGITNKQVLKWREQGTLFDQLSARLAPLQEGQKIASQTVGGYISNIQEVYENTLLNASKPFMAFVKTQVEGLYEALNSARPQLEATVGQILGQVIRIASAVSTTFKSLFGSTKDIITPAIILVFTSFANIVESVAKAVQNTIQVMSPAITVFAALAQSALAVGGPFLQLGIQFKVLSMATGMLGGSFGLLARLLPGVGGLMGVVAVRTMPMINTFANLTGKVGAGSAAFLVLGQNMKHIPGLAGLATNALSRFGPLAPIMTSLIGPLSAIGIKASGVAQVFGSLGAPLFFSNLAKAAPSAITAFAAVAKNASFLNGNTAIKGDIDSVANSLKDYVSQLTNSNQANNLLAGSARAVGVEFRNWAISTGLLAAGLYVGFKAIDKFILKNKEGMEIISAITSGLQDFASIVTQIATYNIPLTVAVMATLITKGQIITSILSGLLALATPLLAKLGFLGVLNGLVLNPTIANFQKLAAVNLVNSATQTEKLSMALSHIPIIGGLASTRMMGLSAALTGLGNVFEVSALKAKAAQAQILAVNAASKLAEASARAVRATEMGASAGAVAKALAAEAAAKAVAQETAANATAMGTSLTKAATGAKSLKAAFIGYDVATKSVTGLVGAIAGMLSPLLIVGGALAIVGLAFSEFKLGGSIWGIQLAKGTRQVAEEMADATGKIEGSIRTVAISIKKARKEQEERTKAGIALTEQEYTANEKLKAQADSELASAEADIEKNKKLLAEEENNDNKKVYERNIESMEIRVKELKEAMEGVDFVPRDLERQGGILEQFGARAEQAMRALATPSGEVEMLKKQASTLIDMTKKQVEAGAITPEVARERLKLVSENVGLEFDLRQQAEQAITDLVTVESDRRIEAETERRNVIQEMASNDLMGEAKLQELTTESTLREIGIRMEAEQKAYEQRSIMRIKDTQEVLSQKDNEIAAIQEKLDLAGPNALQALQHKVTRLQNESSNIAAKQNDLVGKRTELESSGVDTEVEKNELALINAELFQLAKRRNTVATDLSSATASVGKPPAAMSEDDRKKAEQELVTLNAERVAIEANNKGALEDIERRHNIKMQELDAQKAKAEKERRERRNQEQLKDFDERQKLNDSAREQGLKDNQQSAIDSIRITKERSEVELSQIKERTAKLEAEARRQGKTVQEYDKEAWEVLQVQQAEALQKLATARKEGFEKRLADLKQDAQEALAVVEASQAKNDINNQEAATKTTAIATKGINKQLELIEREIAASRGNVERLEELNAKRAGLEKELTEVQKKELQTRLSDLQQDADERLAVIKADNAIGIINNQQAAQETAAIESASADNQLKLIQSRIANVQKADKQRGKVSIELLEELRKQEADTQVKLTETSKKEMESRLADLQQDADERVATIQAANALGKQDHQQTAYAISQIQQQSANEQLKIVQTRITAVVEQGKKSGQINIELLEELRKKESDIQVKITEIQKQELQKRLAALREDAEERTALIVAANANGIIDNQQSAVKTAQIQQESLNTQLALIRQQIATANPLNRELLEDLRKQEADTQVKITEVQKQALQKRLSDLQQDAEERLSVINSLNAQGLIDNQDAAIKSTAIQQQSLDSQLQLIQERLKAVGTTNKELTEELLKQEAETQLKITEIQNQGFQKRLTDLQQDLQEYISIVEAASAMGKKNNQDSAAEIEEIQTKNINAQLGLIRQRVSSTSSLNKELREELKSQEAKLQKELVEIQEQAFQKRLSDVEQDGEERLAIVTSQSVRGLADNQQTALSTAAIQEESAQKQLQLIQDRLARTSESSIELREKLLKLEADTQAKITEIRKQVFEKRLADIEQDGQEQQTILEGQLTQGLTTESEYAQTRYNQTLQTLETQLNLVRERRSQISATDIEGQEVLAAQEASLQKRRQDALFQFLEAQLSLIDRENKKATEALEQAELDRKLIVKQASLSQVSDKDAAADAEIKATQRRIAQEIALEEQRNATLRSLPAFSDPAKEAERQSRIRASVKKTTELRLQLLDEEKRAFDLLVDRQIKAIQNQARQQELASDAQVRSIEQQSRQYDLLSRSLENQNKLLQSRASLANALNGYIQGEYKILQDSASSDGERKRLAKEAADAQLIALQQQQVVAQKNLDIEIKQAEIAQKRAEFEAEIAEIKARAGSAKADAEVLKAEATLQKVRRDPNASNADVAAAELDVVAARAGAEAAQAEVAGAIANKELVGQNREVLEEQNDIKRQTQAIEQATQDRAAQAQAIAAIVDPNERKLAQRQLAGRLSSQEAEQLARIQQKNQEREVRRKQDEAERRALMGAPPIPNLQRRIQAATGQSNSLLRTIEQAPIVPPKVPNLSGILAQVRSEQQKISPRAEVNPLVRLQAESTGYQKEMVGLLQKMNAKPVPEPGKQSVANFNIKAEAGISEAQVLGVFGQVSQEIGQILRR